MSKNSSLEQVLLILEQVRVLLRDGNDGNNGNNGNDAAAAAAAAVVVVVVFVVVVVVDVLVVVLVPRMQMVGHKHRMVLYCVG